MNNNKYTDLIEELNILKKRLIDIDFLDAYTRSKLDKVIEILSSNNYNKNDEKMMFVKDYLSAKDLFHARGIINLLLPLGKINGTR